jgi:ABC-2 type transport system permease protein
MKNLFTLLVREMKSYFYSPVGYVVLFYFLLLMGANTWVLIKATNGYPMEDTIVHLFFGSVWFWFPFLLIFPLITMRVFSEEFRMGTIETLTTAPVTDFQIVFSKLLATYLFSCLLLLPSLVFFATYSHVSGHDMATATGAYWTSYLLIMLISMFYCSIGCLASALTKDQINAAMVSFSTITILFLCGFIFDVANLTDPMYRRVEYYISPYLQMNFDFAKGIVDSRPIIFYLSMSLLVSFLTFQVFQYRKWKS